MSHIKENFTIKTDENIMSEILIYVFFRFDKYKSAGKVLTPNLYRDNITSGRLLKKIKRKFESEINSKELELINEKGNT